MSLGEIIEKLCSNPTFTTTTTVAFLGGMGIAMKGVVMTAAAVSTAASVTSIVMGVSIFLVGAYVAVSAVKAIKVGILDKDLDLIQRQVRHTDSPPIIHAICAVMMIASFTRFRA